uniref:Pseudouridylate synthase 1 homolog n=1 Tax=Pristionchus pacificus TaxID=54126 RepID=A0A8R1UJ34_PRIPA
MLARFAVRFCSTMTKTIENAASSSNSDAALHRVQDGRVGDDSRQDQQKVRVKTNRYAMLLGYQGKNYFGMQVQRGNGEDVCPTIESHILDAMLELGWITPELKQTPYDFFFQRAARTDKAVSAVRQLCSCQMPIAIDLPSHGAELINNKLPDDIKVFGFRRVTKNFHAQKNCDGRTYSYTLPTFAFAKPTELTNSSFRISESTLTQIGEVLAQYKGTHNFFNYTSGRPFNDRSCNRYIISFEVGKPFLYKDEFRKEDVEFVTCTVKGQSFMLHQIRKMIGMMIAIVREMQDPSAVQKSFLSSDRLDIPKAPGLGLLLDRLHYDKYDRQFGNKEPHLPLSNWGDEIETAIDKFKMEKIVSEIMSTEITTQSMMMWLTDLNQHNFLDPTDDGIKQADFVTGAAKKAKEAVRAASAEWENEEEVKNVMEEESEEKVVKKEEGDAVESVEKS